MKILICGSRNFSDKKLMKSVMNLLSKDTIVVEGEARGADTLSREIANEIGIKVEPYPADWDKHGKKAGPIRNQRMIDEGKPDRVMAFFHDINNSRGTWDMIKRAEKNGLSVDMFISDKDTTNE